MSLRHRHKRRQAKQFKVWDHLKDEELGSIRKLHAEWSVETAQDMRAMHGIDVEEELANALTDDLTKGFWE